MTAQEAGAARGWVSTRSSPLFSQHRARGTLWPETVYILSIPLPGPCSAFSALNGHVAPHCLSPSLHVHEHSTLSFKYLFPLTHPMFTTFRVRRIGTNQYSRNEVIDI